MRFAVALTVADLVTFLAMLVIVGSAAEANPLISGALAGGLGGLAAVIVAKLALVVVLTAWRSAVGRLERPVALTGFLVGVIGTASNLWAVVA